MQTAFNLAVIVAGAFGGWMLRLIYDRILELQRTDQSLTSAIDHVKQDYMRRDDFRDFATEIRSILVRIETKIDSKEDKPK